MTNKERYKLIVIEAFLLILQGCWIGLSIWTNGKIKKENPVEQRKDISAACGNCLCLCRHDLYSVERDVSMGFPGLCTAGARNGTTV